jgi:type I restriction enzyme, S subunit
MADKKNIPAVRFKGFSEEWKEKALGEVLTERKVLQKISDDAPILAFASGQGVIDRSERKSNNRDHLTLDQANKIYKLTEYDDIVYNPSNLKYGAIDRNKHGRGVISPIYVTFITDEDSSFIEPIVKTEKFKQKALLFEEGTVVKRQSVKPENLLSLDVCITSNPLEQTKIGAYFQELDQMIELHQRKHEKLVTLKKAMLKKMFPKKGATVPELRFKGFKGEWGERSWFETVDVSTDMVDPRNRAYDELFHIGPGNIESFSGKIYDNVLKVKDSYLISGKFHFNKGDIIYGKINPQLAKYIVAPFEGLASADAYVLNTKNGVVQSYLYVILQTEDFYKYSVSVSARTGMPKINRDELNVYSYKAPEESEQTKIGNFFKSLDTLLKQQQTQLKKLNNIKQACLEKMFV